MKVKCTCRCKDLPDGDFFKRIHNYDCEYDKARRACCYPELIGNKSRGDEIWPVELPNTCPVCGAEATEKKDGTYAKRKYACGGHYEMKPQIQNHTDYFWGRCGDFYKIELD